MLPRLRFALFLTVFIALFGIPLIAVAQDKVEIEMWLLDEESRQCVADTITTLFNATSTTSQINIVLQPNVDDALRTALVGGGGPDIVQSGGTAFAQQYAQAGLLLPLDEYVTQFGWDDRFVPWALELGKFDDVLYTLPDSLETLVIWYNKTLFEDRGWQVPTTMEELFTLSQTIADAGIVPFGNAFGECLECMGWLPGAFINHYAGSDLMYQALTGQISWTDPVFVESITKLNEMVQNGWFGGSVDLLFTDSFDTVHSMLGSGDAAMTLDGSWSNLTDYFGAEAGNDNDFDWFPIPTASGEVLYTTGVGETSSINANTQHPQEAAEFLTWYFSPDVQAERFSQCSWPPAPIQATADNYSQADPRTARIYAEYGTAAGDGHYGYTTWTFFPNAMGVAVNEDIQKVFLGSLTPEEYMQNLQNLFAEAVADNTIPPIPAR